MNDSMGVCPPKPKIKPVKVSEKITMPMPEIKKAKGGKVGLKAMGEKGIERLDRPKRASGGSIMGGNYGIANPDFAVSQKISKPAQE